ncbi:MAG: PadR family transcriptional regulator [Thermoanaerobaculales bacterium]
MDPLTREVLIALWKIHILHHAAQGPVYGQWVAEELGRHGYRISPGTLYPLLKRMETRGWLSPQTSTAANPKARRNYVLTGKGARVLAVIKRQVADLQRELTEEAEAVERQLPTHRGRASSPRATPRPQRPKPDVHRPLSGARRRASRQTGIAP